MDMEIFFAPLHIVYMLIPLFLVTLLYLLFKNRPKRVKKTVVLVIAILNTLQHILKPYIYPQYFGESLGARSTAYNMCALLILISPIVIAIGSELWQNFMFYVGSIAGYSSILVTYWLASPVEEQIRFVICHGLLFLSSFLPLLFGIYKINYRKFWRIPFVFFACLGVLIISNMINFILGIAGDTGDLTLLEFLYRENPCWAMCPPAGYPFVLDIISPFTPSAFLSAKGGVDTPILWYALPLFVFITAAGFILGIILDAKHFIKDLKRIFTEKNQGE